MTDAHDHASCCGPESPWAARQWLYRQPGTHAYRWRTRGWRDAIFCERPQVNAVALQWDQNRQGLYR